MPSVNPYSHIRDFNPLPPCGGRPLRSAPDFCNYISIHSLRVEGDHRLPAARRKTRISIHSLRVEGDYRCHLQMLDGGDFNPLPPCGGRLVVILVRDRIQRISIHSLRVEGDRCMTADYNATMAFQSTPSVWRETQKGVVFQRVALISIHSLRVEGDLTTPDRWREWTYFNPLPPCGGRPNRPTLFCANRHFNPLPPCGGRRRCACALVDLKSISIHSLRVEGDWTRSARSPTISNFNPLPPCGGRRRCAISSAPRPHFNPLPPCGGRRPAGGVQGGSRLFQSTPSVWRETFCGGDGAVGLIISIHSLRVEGDRCDARMLASSAISIHSLRVEGDSAEERQTAEP